MTEAPPAAPLLPAPSEVPPEPAAALAGGGEEASAWYDRLTFGAFADGYFAVDLNFPKGGKLDPARRRNPIRAYDAAPGFSLVWVGLDVAMPAEPVGGALALRFGPAAQRLAAACVDGECDSDIGLENVKQGYVSWKPVGAVTLDLGKFDTPYGAEVAESQYNINYTRGVLYWLGQPAYHTGLRLSADVNRNFNLRLLAVNGWNRSIDNNPIPSGGVQGTLRVPAEMDTENDLVTVAVGYMIGPEHDDFALQTCPPGFVFDIEDDPADGCVPDPTNTTGDSGVVDRGTSNTKGLRHFLDLTLVATPTPVIKLLLNASLGIDNQRSTADLREFEAVSWWGVMAGARYALSDELGVAGRAEYYSDEDGYTTTFAGNEIQLVTGTVTLDYSPGDAATLYLDARLDWSNKEIFPSELREEDNAGTAVSATLGAVFMTN